MSDIKVSVIIPVYNAEEYLRQCIDSVVSQTLKEIEIILVNDASTDGSLAICREYEAADERVGVIDKNTNAGLAAARNSGMDHCRGEYIAFVDSDDWLEFDAYEKMYAAAKTNDSDIVFCNCYENESGMFSKSMPCGAYDRDGIKSVILPRTLPGLNKRGERNVIRWSNCLRMFKRKTLIDNAIRFDDRFRRCQDLQLTYEATLVAQNYYYLGDDYLYHNRVVKTSLSRGYTKNMWSLLVPLIERLYEDTRKFKELDLMDNMHLCTYFFVMDVIENEIKASAPGNKKDKIEKLRQMITHPLCVGCLDHIPTERLGEYLRTQYKNIKKQNANAVYSYYFRYRKKNKLTLSVRAKANKVIDSRAVQPVYIRVRKLFNKNYVPKV